MNSITGIDSKKCFGCTACVAECPKSAIRMASNDHGFLVPEVDETLCVDCGLCKKVCPALYERKEDDCSETTFYSFRNPRTDRLYNSTSGGVFSYLVDSVKPDAVCGCVYENKTVKHIIGKDESAIKKMMRSKYVQSNVGDCFKEIRSLLEKGKTVLFSGTSCQVQGLNNYLSINNVDSNNLITLDIICHGVPSPKVYSDYLAFYESKKKCKVYDHIFRSKKYGWGNEVGVLNYMQTIITDKGIDNKSFEANLYQNVFFSDYCTRERCFSCPFTTVNKPAKISMGDFWGVSSVFKGNYADGCSLVMVRDDKIAKIFDGNVGAERVLQEYCETIKKNQPRLMSPTKRPSRYDFFWEDYENMSFQDLAKKYFRYTKTNKVLYFFFIICIKLKINKLAKKIARKVFI